MSLDSPIQLRPARGADARQIHAIYSHHVSTGYGSFDEVAPPVETIGTRIVDTLGLRLPFLVAEHDGAVVGYASAAPFRPRIGYRFTLENSVYVGPDHTRQGIGRMLLDAVVAAVSQGTWRQMIAVIGGGERLNPGSIALHRAAGFTVSGTLIAVGWKHGGWVDVTLMQRALGDGATTLPGSRVPTLG